LKNTEDNPHELEEIGTSSGKVTLYCTFFFFESVIEEIGISSGGTSSGNVTLCCNFFFWKCDSGGHLYTPQFEEIAHMYVYYVCVFVCMYIYITYIYIYVHTYMRLSYVT